MMALSFILHFGACVVLLVAGLGTDSVAANSQRRRHRRHHSIRCSEPTDLNERLGDLLTNDVQRQLHETFYMLPFLREVASNETQRYDFITGNTKQLQVFNGSTECPAGDAEEFRGNPCPTYYSVNTDNNRYPRILMETRCRDCVQCRGIPPQDYLDNFVIPTCEPVPYYVRVLRKTGCHGGVHQYAPAWERIQIGCACQLVPTE